MTCQHDLLPHRYLKAAQACDAADQYKLLVVGDRRNSIAVSPRLENRLIIDASATSMTVQPAREIHTLLMQPTGPPSGLPVGLTAIRQR